MEYTEECIDYIWAVVKKVNMHVIEIPEAKRENCPITFEEVQRNPLLITLEANY